MYRLSLLALLAITATTFGQTERTSDPGAASAKEAEVPKGPPLPLHTIEGVGGVVITPIAYLVNAGPEGTVFGLPSISATYVNARKKNVQSLVITEILWHRLELGYAASRFGVGDLPTEVQKATGVDIGCSDVWLHNFNARFLAVPENSFSPLIPALTVGAHLKVNDGIDTIDDNLGGALKGIGLEDTTGVDFTLTASKSFPKVIGRPLIASATVRLSKADQLGYVGFGDEYRASLEGNLVYLVTNNVGLAVEYRQKRDPYGRIGDLVRPEEDWWTAGAGFVLNSYTTATVEYGHFGNVLNTVENTGWAVQLKHEF